METNQSEQEETSFRPPSQELFELLLQATRLAAEEGLDHDDFMRAAWVAYVESRPDFRAKLIEMKMMAELAEMRAGGRIPDA